VFQSFRAVKYRITKSYTPFGGVLNFGISRYYENITVFHFIKLRRDAPKFYIHIYREIPKLIGI